MTINWHKVIAFLSVGGAAAAAAISGGTIPAVVAGIAAAMGTLLVRPSQVSRKTRRAARAIPGIKGATGAGAGADPADMDPDPIQITDAEDPR